jgi:hypothetical protein
MHLSSKSRIIGTLLFVAFAGVFLSHGGENEGAEVLIVNAGTTSKLAVTPGSNAVLSACEEALKTAPRVTKLAVTEATIAAIKRNTWSVEIRYKKTKDFKIGELNRTVTLDRILIPLSGSYAETSDHKRYVTIFYGNGRFEHGPFSNSAATYDSIVAALKSAGISEPANSDARLGR